MALPILNTEQQKKALSGLKKKKKLKKNVLALPDNLSIKKPVFKESDILNITKLLESVLPGARLPATQPAQKQSDDSSAVNKKETISEQHLKRKQLLIGINSVSRGISKKTVACFLLADDIQPHFLYRHLLVLCSLKYIPYIFMPGFRELTRNALGFPCIVLGFKNNSTDFLPVINLIKSVFASGSILLESKVQKDEETDHKVEDDSSEKVENYKFSYVERESKTKRTFVPDVVVNAQEVKNNNKDFIPVPNDEESVEKNVVDKKDSKIITDIKREVFHQKQKQKKALKMKQNKKKFPVASKYYPSQIMEVSSNPNRSKKKFKKLK
ncbi:UNVERIFIED_CONTAM: hypothetical protein PYX00_003203 [Menopon gallinae]|uniref:Ribosomal protein eL8/eL30/eS12/Gadd45 domain-containing protein n=1 Tax=Menopon gallinae TaxID=328185 RepID=A0AAW2I0M1_9NEOP